MSRPTEAPNDELCVVWDKYLLYLKDWADSHDSPEFYGMTPACFDEWFDNEFQDE